MIKADLHVHTYLSDGRDAPEAMVKAAIARGMDCLGFSDHSYTAFDTRWCLSRENAALYPGIIGALREKYAGQLRILLGIEQDYYATEPAVGYDYVIGSVHYICADGCRIPVDESPEILKRAAEEHFGGDLFALAERYFETVGDVVRQTGATIIGHFDLISKFNEGDRLFDSRDPRYERAWRAAADRLLETGMPFELNTGAIARGYRTEPYPRPDMIEYIRKRGGRLILTGDVHATENLCYAFDEYEKYV